MSMIFLGKGHCRLGATKKDRGGNVVESTRAQFVFDETGGSVVIGKMDPETDGIDEESVSIYGDWDAAGYLNKVLELLKPRRKVNIPDFQAIIRAAYIEDGNDLVCDYCKSVNCQDCIVKEWKEDLG